MGDSFARDEVEAAFAHFYKLGCVDEDWTGWADLFTDDCMGSVQLHAALPRATSPAA